MRDSLGYQEGESPWATLARAVGEQQQRARDDKRRADMTETLRRLSGSNPTEYEINKALAFDEWARERG